jgi:hypothetical protein
VAALAGCSGSPAPEERRDPIPSGGAVLYTIGVSTDPYGSSRPNGFGVATRLLRGEVATVEVRSREYGWFNGAEWLPGGRILVHRRGPPLRQPAIFEFRAGRLERTGFAPFVSGSAYGWSPAHELLAVERPAPCEPGQASLFACYRGSGRIAITGGPERLELKGTSPYWTRDGRLLYYRTPRDLNRGRAVVLDVSTGRTSVQAPYWPNEAPLASPDGNYFADRGGNERGSLLTVSNRRGRVVQRFATPYIVSMVAWSPRGNRLAYTTSGFPDPHELFIVDVKSRESRRVFASGAPHFDWITWSPDGRWLLLDGDEAGGWRVFSAESGEQVRRLPRLGGRPFWCCPVNRYDALVGRSG